MIIRIDSAAAANADTARQYLHDLACEWGSGITAEPALAAAPPGGKAVHPVAVASLVISIPSAALTALDLADRITKRRAAQLTGTTRHLAPQITISIVIADAPIPLAGLDPDQIFDHAAAPDPAAPATQDGQDDQHPPAPEQGIWPES